MGKASKPQTEPVSGNDTETSSETTIAAGQLRAFIERIERLEEEKKALNSDIKSVYAEAKGFGFDTKAVRAIIILRQKDEDERHEEEALVKLYAEALGMPI